MALNITHGVTVTETAGSAPALNTVSTSDIGIVVTGADADAAMFPLNQPVLITDLDIALGKAGDDGTFATTLQAIADQVRTPVIVVRVEEGADEAETNAAVIGGTVAGQKTGMQALLASQAKRGRIPRILGAPGLDTQAVTTAMAIVAKKLRGMAYAAAIGDDVAAAGLYRANFSARELMLLYPDFLATNSLGVADISYGTARALGLRALIDQTQGWHKSLSNVPVAGVVGLSKDIQFDIQDMSVEAGILNQAGITALIRDDDGFKFWGNSTCSADPLFRFETATRTANVLAETIAIGLKWAVDKPLTPSIGKDVVEVINRLISRLVRNGQLIGGKAWFSAAKNPVEELAQGKLAIDYDYTPVPPLEHLGLTQRITDTYFANFGAAIAG